MRKPALLSMLVLGALLIPATAAEATPPVVTPPTSFEVVVPFPGVCAFPMTATVLGRTLAITFVDANGNAIRGFAAGQLFVTWQRDDTGFARTFTISGPSFFDAAGDAVLGTGRWTTPMVDAGWVLASGHLTFDGTQDGFSLISTMNGHARSLCALMS